MPNDTVSAAAHGLPAAHSRRTMLGVSAATIAGAVAAVVTGAPAHADAAVASMAVPEPADRTILEAYREWLHYECRMCGMELYPEMGAAAERFIPATSASRFHFPPDGGWRDVPTPSARAEFVLRAVGALALLQASPAPGMED